MLRDFRVIDQQAVHDLVQSGLRDRWGESFDPSFNDDLADITANYLDRGADVVVIEHAGEIVATGMLVPEGPDQARIVRMSVSGRHRRMGLARQIVDELIDRARRNGVRQVLVATDTPWTSALALYQSCGFVETHRDATDTHFSMSL